METKPWLHYDSSLQEKETTWDVWDLRNYDFLCIFSESYLKMYISKMRKE